MLTLMSKLAMVGVPRTRLAGAGVEVCYQTGACSHPSVLLGEVPKSTYCHAVVICKQQGFLRLQGCFFNLGLATAPLLKLGWREGRLGISSQEVASSQIGPEKTTSHTVALKGLASGFFCSRPAETQACM